MLVKNWMSHPALTIDVNVYISLSQVRHQGRHDPDD